MGSRILRWRALCGVFPVAMGWGGMHRFRFSVRGVRHDASEPGCKSRAPPDSLAERRG